MSRPGGFGPMAPGIVNTSYAGFNSVSDDGCRAAFRSGSDGLSPDDDDAVVNVFVRDSCTNTTTLVSRASGAGGAPADGDSFSARISGDGTRVAFDSRAANLSPDDADTARDVYVRNLQTGSTVLASRATGAGGAKQNGSACDDPTLSDDGTRVAFSCNATNLHPDDGDGTIDVFLRDLAASATTLVSRAAGAAGVKANGAAREPVISGDGTRVAFETGATNLVAGDTDTTYDIVVRNLGDATNTLASRQNGAAGAKGTSSSFYPDISQDGTKVAFRSSGLGDPSGQVYVRDLAATTTTLVSRATGAGGAAADALSDRPTISDDGTRVAFETGAQNLSGIDTNGSLTDVYVRDLTGNATTLVSESFGTVGSSASAGAALSGDGLVAGFQTEADNLTTQDSDDFASIVRRRLTQNGMSLVSRPTGTGGFGGDGTAESSITCCGTPASADGSIVAFSSQTDTISPDDDNRFRNAFVRDARTGETTLLSRQTGPGGAPADGDSAAVAVSADGRRAAFVSSATNLVAGGDANGTQQDLFVRDLGTGETMLVSRGPGAAGPQGGSSVFVAALDADGSAVAFSTSSNLVPGSASGIDVYVRDIPAADTVLASRADGELGAAVNSDPEIAISGDGRVVAFTSDAAIAGAPGGVDQIFARDLGAGTTTLVSRAPGAAGAAGGFSSRSPALDADGSRVAFASYASNLALDDPDTAGDVFVRDRATGETLLASRATGASGVKGDGESEDPTISADGSRVLLTSSSSNLVAGGTGSQAYLRDLASQTTILAARADGAAGAPADPITARLAAGGHCVVFESSRRGLAPEYSGDHRQVYLRALDAECPAPVPPVPSPPPPSPGPPGPPPATVGPSGERPPGRARPLSRALRVDRSGRIRLRLSCPASTSGCRGTARLLTASAKPRSATTRRTVIATRSFAIAPRASATVTLRLAAKTRALVRHARSLRATLELAPRGLAGRRTFAVTVRRDSRRG